jgi:hypothetical protein
MIRQQSRAWYSPRCLAAGAQSPVGDGHHSCERSDTGEQRAARDGAYHPSLPTSFSTRDSAFKWLGVSSSVGMWDSFWAIGACVESETGHRTSLECDERGASDAHILGARGTDHFQALHVVPSPGRSRAVRAAVLQGRAKRGRLVAAVTTACSRKTVSSAPRTVADGCA